jgi:hypothetical protein
VLRRQQPALSSLGIHIEISKPGRQGINVVIKKRELGERCEDGLDEKSPERKVYQSASVTSNTVRI